MVNFCHNESANSSMGAKISYNIAVAKKGLLEIFFDNYTAYRNWIIDEEYNELISPKVLQLLIDNPALPIIETLSPKILDAIIESFFFYYCDFGEGKDIFESEYPYMNKWKYEDSTMLVNTYCNAETRRIWNYLVDGRSLSDGLSPHCSADDDNAKIAFWTVEEQQYLRKSLENRFGTRIEISERFWSASEKKSFHESIQKSVETDRSYTLINTNTITQGIEFVLQVLETVQDKRREIVIAVE